MALTAKEQQAKNLYVNADHTQAEIANLLDVNRKTVHLWIKKGAWEQMKISAQQAPAAILQNIHNHIYKVNKKIAARDEEDRCPTMEEINMLRKLVNMTKAFPEKSVGTYMEAFSDFTMHMDKVNHNLAKELTPHLERYMLGVIMNKDINLDEYNSSGIYIGPTESESDKNGEFSILPDNAPDIAINNTYKPKNNIKNAPFPPLENLSENGEFVEKEVNQNRQNPTVHNSASSKHLFSDNLSGEIPIATGRCEAIPTESGRDKNGEFSIVPENDPTPATIATYEPKHNAQNAPSMPLKIYMIEGNYQLKNIMQTKTFYPKTGVTCPMVSAHSNLHCACLHISATILYGSVTSTT